MATSHFLTQTVISSAAPTIHGINNRFGTDRAFTFNHGHNFVANVPYDIFPVKNGQLEPLGREKITFKAGTDDHIPRKSCGRIRLTTQGAEFMAIKRNFFRSNASLGFYPEREILTTIVSPTGEPRQVLVNKVRVKLNEWTPPIPCNGTLVISKLKIEVYIPVERVMSNPKKC